MLMIIQNLIMSIFCTIDKTMVTENLQKIQKTRKRFFFAIFYEYGSYKTYLTEELIYRYYYTKLSYIAFIFYLFLTSHVIVMRCGCNGPFGIQIEGGFPIEKEKEKEKKQRTVKPKW